MWVWPVHTIVIKWTKSSYGPCFWALLFVLLFSVSVVYGVSFMLFLPRFFRGKLHI